MAWSDAARAAAAEARKRGKNPSGVQGVTRSALAAHLKLARASVREAGLSRKGVNALARAKAKASSLQEAQRNYRLSPKGQAELKAAGRTPLGHRYNVVGSKR